MNKKAYTKAEMEIVVFSAEDVITASEVTWFPDNDETEMIRP